MVFQIQNSGYGRNRREDKKPEMSLDTHRLLSTLFGKQGLSTYRLSDAGISLIKSVLLLVRCVVITKKNDNEKIKVNEEEGRSGDAL